jgi:hypothetical protein
MPPDTRGEHLMLSEFGLGLFVVIMLSAYGGAVKLFEWMILNVM